MTGALWLPPSAEAERVEQAQVMDAERNEKLAESLLTIQRYWNRLLKDADPRLELVWVGGADGQDHGYGLIGQRWHVKCHIAGGADHFWAIVGEDNEYREPDSRVLEDIAEQRFTSPGFFARAARRRARAEAQAQRAKEAEREALREEMAGRIKAKLNPAINYDPDVKWRARVKTQGE